MECQTASIRAANRGVSRELPGRPTSRDRIASVRSTLALALAFLAGDPAQEAVELSFHPAAGTVLAKSFEIESRGHIEALRLNDSDITNLLAGLDALSVESTMQVADEYLAVGGGRPLELVRDFDALETCWGWRSKHDVLHPLLYRSVRFTWDPRHERYDKEWQPRRGSVRPLDGVWEDLDFRGLLPGEPVRVGETWHVPLRAFAPVLLPGGSIQRDELLWDEWSLFELEDTLAPRSRHWFQNEDVACRLEEIVRVEDRPCARISVRWAWWGQLDLYPEDDEDSWWLRFATLGAFVELELHGQGELLWDLEGGHFASFELAAECEAELDVRGETYRIEVEAEGSAEWTARATRSE